MTDAPLLEVRQLSKRFPGVRALHEVSLTLGRGEVLALIGENGAGKSTLMKILAGVQPADTGEILIDGEPVRFENVSDAMAAGVVLIHQELNLCDNLDVASNIYLGREPLRSGLIDRATMRANARKVLDMIGLDVDPATPLHRLTIGHQQLVEIAKALSVNARVLIMDEPTSSLSQHETENLFRVVKDLRTRGVSVIYISHRLGEVKELADRVSVLRDGENAGDLDRERIDHDAMVRMMVGRDISQFYARKQHPVGDVLLDVRDLVTPAWPRHKLSFTVRAGEIVGFAGLIGAGRTEMLRALFGIDKPLGGTITFDGQPLDAHDPQRVIGRGMALVPEDRKQHGLVVEMSVRHNLGLPALRRHSGRGGWLNRSREDTDAAAMIDRMNIKTPSPDQIAQYLSGGNQQKVVIGKWLCLGPKLLLLDEPTRGIDVGAKQEIYGLMEQLAEQGMGIVFVSSEMEEILGMSDRVLVMHEGRITGELSRDELGEEPIMQLATGGEEMSLS
ncbi:sugar ABC transporter ATP-binding protein [Planctomycetales bacterium ZRK34]|nr:sugar ABC transporter ATP-binding protein [Planctomycetales bacterium ZRK34]